VGSTGLSAGVAIIQMLQARHAEKSERQAAERATGDRLEGERKAREAAAASKVAAKAKKMKDARTRSWSRSQAALHTFNPDTGRFLGSSRGGDGGGRFDV